MLAPEFWSQIWILNFELFFYNELQSDAVSDFGSLKSDDRIRIRFFVHIHILESDFDIEFRFQSDFSI